MQPLLGEALIARDSHRLAESQAHHRRLPSSKRAVSILQLWCTLTFMHVDARLALNQSWDHGGQHGQESEEGKEEDRQEEKEVGPTYTLPLLRHVKARALCHREADIAAA
jgi:hypothetical protein